MKRPYTFEELSDHATVLSGDLEQFNHPSDYEWLWEQMQALTEGRVQLGPFEGETIDDIIVPIRTSAYGKTWKIQFPNNIGFLNEEFISWINGILDDIAVTDKRFYEVAPNGVENSDGSYNIAFLTPEAFKRLDENGYGNFHPKWKDYRADDDPDRNGDS